LRNFLGITVLQCYCKLRDLWNSGRCWSHLFGVSSAERQ